MSFGTIVDPATGTALRTATVFDLLTSLLAGSPDNGFVDKSTGLRVRIVDVSLETSSDAEAWLAENDLEIQASRRSRLVRERMLRFIARGTFDPPNVVKALRSFARALRPKEPPARGVGKGAVSAQSVAAFLRLAGYIGSKRLPGRGSLRTPGFIISVESRTRVLVDFHVDDGVEPAREAVLAVFESVLKEAKLRVSHRPDGRLEVRST